MAVMPNLFHLRGERNDYDLPHLGDRFHVSFKQTWRRWNHWLLLATLYRSSRLTEGRAGVAARLDESANGVFSSARLDPLMSRTKPLTEALYLFKCSYFLLLPRDMNYKLTHTRKTGTPVGRCFKPSCFFFFFAPPHSP